MISQTGSPAAEAERFAPPGVRWTTKRAPASTPAITVVALTHEQIDETPRQHVSGAQATRLARWRAGCRRHESRRAPCSSTAAARQRHLELGAAAVEPALHRAAASARSTDGGVEEVLEAGELRERDSCAG